MSHKVIGRRLLAPAVVALSLGLLAGPAQAQDRTVVAYGQGSVKPTPKDKNSNASIAAAVKAAAAKALPLAIANAQQQATELATAAGVTLGQLLSISNEQQQPFYGPFFGQDGTFGPGRYCGKSTTIRRVKGKNGKTRIVRSTRRRCRIPSQVVRQVELTYEIVG
jgi:uncharacterized protein YggE